MLILNNNSILKLPNNTWLTVASAPVDPGLQPFTIRIKCSAGTEPTGLFSGFEEDYPPCTKTLVNAADNIWDITYTGDGSDYIMWDGIFKGLTNIIEVVDANVAGVYSMDDVFSGCSNLTSVALFDTSTVVSMGNTFAFTGITSVPLFDLSSCEYTSNMFYGCTAVTTGALALYQKTSSQTTLPNSYGDMFKNCGSGTSTGQAELAQIPTSWGGTMSSGGMGGIVIEP